MEDTARRNNSAIAFAKRLFSGREKSSSIEKGIVDQQTKKSFKSSDAKVHHPLTNKTSGADRRDIIIRRESATYTPHFAMTTFLEADEFFSFAIGESAEVPGFQPAVVIPDSLDLTNVTDLSESVLSGYETGFDDLLVLNSTQQELDITGCSYGKQIHRSTFKQ